MNFRTDSKELFYTFPQCDVPLMDLHARLMAAWHIKARKVVDYIICSETHKDEGLHRHAYIKLDRAYTNEYDPRDFDILGHHPNIQAAKKKKNVIGYVAKDGDYISNLTKATIDKCVKDRLKRKEKDPKTGKRAAIATDLLSGNLALKDLCKKYPDQLFYLDKWVKNFKLNQRLNRKEPEKLNELDNYWLWGKAGVGKTEWVFNRFPNAWSKPADPWWNGYEDQETVIINDVGPDWKDVLYCLKTWSEHRPFNGRIKSEDPIFIRPKRICITSNYTISQLLELLGVVDQHLIDSLKRRFKLVHIEETKDDDIDLELVDQMLINYDKPVQCEYCIFECHCIMS